MPNQKCALCTEHSHLMASYFTFQKRVSLLEEKTDYFFGMTASSSIVILLACQSWRRIINNMVMINCYSLISMLLQEWIMVSIYIIALSIVAILPGS